MADHELGRRVPDRWQWLVPVFVALISLVLSGYVNYSRADKTNAVDIAKLQIQREEDKERMLRIESGVLRLEDKLDIIILREQKR